MQDEFDTEYPLLSVDFLGVNQAGLEIGNPSITEGKEIPWLQDVDADNDGASDVWASWSTKHLDVVVADANNELAGMFNLVGNSLAEAENYDTLRQMILDAATVEPPTEIDLLSATDSGTDPTDNRTNFNNSSADLALQFQISGVVDGAIVRLFADDTQIGQATASGSEVLVTTDGTTPLPDGRKLVTANQEVNGLVSQSSPSLKVYIDTTVGFFTRAEATVNQLFLFDAGNSDEGEVGFSYSLVEAPTGVTIDADTGVVRWTPTADQFGRQQFTIEATDLVGNTRSQTVLVDVLGLAPDFALVDVNATSTTYNQAVSPRDYLEQVSGWYFTYST